MNARQFLSHVLPTSGPYCIATPTPQGWRHKTFDSIAQAAFFAEELAETSDTYMAVCSLKERRVLGADGKYHVRTSDNIAFARAFILDLDVEPNNPKKYASQADALRGLIQFTKTVGLPVPTVTSSGGGLHVYWTFEQHLDPVRWKTIALLLKQLCQAHGLKADPMRTADTSSVLRVAGTYNHKNGQMRPVEVIKQGQHTPSKRLAQIIITAATELGLKPEPPRSHKSTPAPVRQIEGLDSNIDGLEMFAKPEAKSIIRKCGQLARLLTHPNEISEPEWYRSLQVLAHCKDADTAVHKASRGYAGYDHDEVEAKVYNLKSKAIGPTLCQTFHQNNPDICQNCPLHGKIKTPLHAAGIHYKELPEEDLVFNVEVTPGEIQQIERPKLPKGYKNTSAGIVMVGHEDDEGESIGDKIVMPSGYDFWVHSMSARSRSGEHGTLLHCYYITPDGGRVMEPRSIDLAMGDMAEPKTIHRQLGNAGLPISDWGTVVNYMSAYVKQIHHHKGADEQYSHLGWNEGVFVMPTKALTLSSESPARVAGGALNDIIRSQGSPEIARKVLGFFRDSRYVAHQFYILCAAGAPLMSFTNHNGVLVNMQGRSGVGKSATLKAAAGIWGDPQAYLINGSRGGTTINSLFHSLATLHSLPLPLDDVTRLDPRDVGDLALNVSVGEDKRRLNKNLTQRITGKWRTTVLTTSNPSMYDSLSAERGDGSAEAMRVFEIPAKAPGVHTKQQADRMMDACFSHYGHVGEVLASHYARHQQSLKSRVKEMENRIDAHCGCTGPERFWSAVAATAFVAGEILHELGMCPYDLEAIMSWLKDVQIPYLRNAVDESFAKPCDVITQFLSDNVAGTMVTTESILDKRRPTIAHEPRIGLDIRIDITPTTRIAYIRTASFKRFCTQHGFNYRDVTSWLIASKIFTPSAAYNMGKGTYWQSGTCSCFIMNLRNPEVAGALEELEPENNVISLAEKRKKK